MADVAHFNEGLRLAREAIASAPANPVMRRAHLRTAHHDVTRSLGEANRMRDPKRAALCLKILNWLRTDLRRSAAAIGG
jgi:hypothetical protein